MPRDPSLALGVTKKGVAWRDILHPVMLSEAKHLYLYKQRSASVLEILRAYGAQNDTRP